MISLLYIMEAGIFLVTECGEERCINKSGIMLFVNFLISHYTHFICLNRMFSLPNSAGRYVWCWQFMANFSIILANLAECFWSELCTIGGHQDVWHSILGKSNLKTCMVCSLNVISELLQTIKLKLPLQLMGPMKCLCGVAPMGY